ncbi:hypothetical protein CYMTET_52135 [Cymbomonas tetramitiformis]|uniref:Uncharacterized protein n=1 Tax=Cymbomonas tetramitiformis TaxID=36881 RepID=A0AAE0BKX4_9CHLO|nr:hypothetical protein CYMTET_52135 [Cymbomonas tetramitiformis]
MEVVKEMEVRGDMEEVGSTEVAEDMEEVVKEEAEMGEVVKEEEEEEEMGEVGSIENIHRAINKMDGQVQLSVEGPEAVLMLRRTMLGGMPSIRMQVVEGLEVAKIENMCLPFAPLFAPRLSVGGGGLGGGGLGGGGLGGGGLGEVGLVEVMSKLEKDILDVSISTSTCPGGGGGEVIVGEADVGRPVEGDVLEGWTWASWSWDLMSENWLGQKSDSMSENWQEQKWLGVLVGVNVVGNREDGERVGAAEGTMVAGDNVGIEVGVTDGVKVGD